MPWMRLTFTPGIFKDRTRYAADGYWYDGNLVRFREGLPEIWSGWTRAYPDFEFLGIGRSLNRWSSLDGAPWTALGTNRLFYVIGNTGANEVTPIASTATLAANPIETFIGENRLRITDVAHGQGIGNFVIISGATGVGGILASQINNLLEIANYIDDDHYEVFVAGAPATSSATGGGAAVQVQYLFQAGGEDQISGTGWGSLGWGIGPWGGTLVASFSDKMGIWSQDNWGEDLVANAQHGPIFLWDRTNPTARMVDLLDIPGADGNAPAESNFILISHRDRHLLSFGCTEFGTGTVNPMTVRWCSQEDLTDWNEASLVGTAGSLPFSQGSKFISAIATQREILVWSDAAIFSMQYIGAPLIYSVDIIEPASDIVGLKACCTHNSAVYWMGRSGFYLYSGRIERINCPVWDYIFQRMNWEQATKVYASSNRLYNEVIFFYPSNENGNNEIDSYVALDINSGAWNIGSLPRTAWLDENSLNDVIAASIDGKLYYQNVGSEDESTDPPSPLNAYVESYPIELSAEGAFDKGDRFMFIRRILPDVTFRNYSSGSVPTMDIVLKMMDMPGGGFDNTSSSQVSRTATIPVEEFTTQAHVRLRGRAMVFRAQSNYSGTQWRLGIPRIDVRTDGRR